MKKIVVLMSTYNGERFIKEQIDSILNQKNCDVSIIVRDDGSKDKTKEILEEYKKKDLLDWYCEDNNLGPANSFISLLYKCNDYDFYAFADQDDFWEPNKLNKAIMKLDKLNCPALYCSNALLVDENLISMEKKVYKNVPNIDLYTNVTAGNILGCTMVLNKKLVDILISKCKPNKIIMHDAYVASVCVSIGGKIVFEDYAGVLYRQHGKNVIGYKVGITKKIKQCLKLIFTKRKVSIADVATEILKNYDNEIPEKNKKWLRKISKYRKNIVYKISLAFSFKSRYSSRNLINRLSILFGNR